MDVEFVDEAPGWPDGRGDELRPPDPRRRTRQRLAAAIGLLALAVLGTIAALHRAPASHRPAAAVAPSPAAPVRPARPVPVARSEADLAQPLSTIYRRASEPRRPARVVRADAVPGSCRPVLPGAAPHRAAARELAGALPGYRVVAISRTVNRSGALCEFTVRARNRDGTIAVMIVTSPSSRPPCCGIEQLDVGSSRLGARLLQYARFATPDRWSVLLGTVGRPERAPEIAVLENLASSSRLRW
jgi:hypothetical protein